MHPQVMAFGKYRGISLAEIARRDPQYLDWLVRSTTGDIRHAAANALSEHGAALVQNKKRGRIG